jgi:hypothetical protein
MNPGEMLFIGIDTNQNFESSLKAYAGSGDFSLDILRYFYHKFKLD